MIFFFSIDTNNFTWSEKRSSEEWPQETRKPQIQAKKILTKISIFLVIRVGKFSEIFFTYFVLFWKRLSFILSNPVYD